MKNLLITILIAFNFKGEMKMGDGKKPEEGAGGRKSSEVDTEEECCDSLYRWVCANVIRIRNIICNQDI